MAGGHGHGSQEQYYEDQFQPGSHGHHEQYYDDQHHQEYYDDQWSHGHHGHHGHHGLFRMSGDAVEREAAAAAWRERFL